MGQPCPLRQCLPHVEAASSCEVPHQCRTNFAVVVDDEEVVVVDVKPKEIAVDTIKEVKPIKSSKKKKPEVSDSIKSVIQKDTLIRKDTLISK